MAKAGLPEAQSPVDATSHVNIHGIRGEPRCVHWL
jgi:hypothetical protein